MSLMTVDRSKPSDSYRCYASYSVAVSRRGVFWFYSCGFLFEV